MQIQRIKKRGLFISGSILAAFLLIMLLLPDSVPLRSDAHGVTFLSDDGLITEVIVNGSFPYTQVISYPDRQVIEDEFGNTKEIIQSYTMKAALSMNLRTSLHLYIETPDMADHTYILNFADKTVTITNGKVAEEDYDKS